MNRLSFSELEAELTNAPATWVPALLRTTINRAVDQDVFKPGGLQKFVENSVNLATTGSTGMACPTEYPGGPVRHLFVFGQRRCQCGEQESPT
jgi:hypothetical protein